MFIVFAPVKMLMLLLQQLCLYLSFLSVSLTLVYSSFKGSLITAGYRNSKLR